MKQGYIGYVFERMLRKLQDEARIYGTYIRKDVKEASG